MEMPSFSSDSEMFILDQSAQAAPAFETDTLNSNAMVMDMLSSIQLDCFDDKSMDFFDAARAHSPFQQILNDNANAMGAGKGEQMYGLGPGVGERIMGSPLSHMYSPLSEPGTPVMSMGSLDSIQNPFGSFDSFDGNFDPSFDGTFDPSAFDHQSNGYESDPQVNMFASPQMGEYQINDYQMNSPPMTPMSSLTSSPLMHSYSLPIDTSSAMSSPEMSEMNISMPSPTIGLNAKKEQVFKCGCGKSFKKLHSLELHSKLHQRDRAYGCGMCGKRFLRPHDLKRHKITHIEGYKPFECTHCGVTFTRQDAMHRHVNAKRCLQ
jgi:DNA-directed RNA polymerase subunit RPC12/RpoP